jgi:hypothetical protein
MLSIFAFEFNSRRYTKDVLTALLSAAGNTVTGAANTREIRRFKNDEVISLWRSLGKLLPQSSGMTALVSPQLINKLVAGIERKPGRLGGVGAADILRGMSDLGRWGAGAHTRSDFSSSVHHVTQLKS